MRGARPSVLVVDGPSLGALGRRDPAQYGTATYRELTASVKAWADDLGMDVESIQSDSEGGIVSAVWAASGRLDALVINPGGYAHGSMAIRDAMEGFDGPVIEVHLSQVMAREPERRILVTARAADVLICGAGTAGYRLALELVPGMMKA